MLVAIEINKHLTHQIPGQQIKQAFADYQSTGFCD